MVHPGLVAAIRLTPTSYIVLGLIEHRGEATPYELKQAVADGIGDFWSVQHAQLYAEPDRLAGAGYLTQTREQSGRRRKFYRLAPPGRQALRSWLAAPTGELPELRDVALLKLYFGARPPRLAEAQIAAHRERLAGYERLWQQAADELPAGAMAALEAGVAHERAWVWFWSAQASAEDED